MVIAVMLIEMLVMAVGGPSGAAHRIYSSLSSY